MARKKKDAAVTAAPEVEQTSVPAPETQESVPVEQTAAVETPVDATATEPTEQESVHVLQMNQAREAIDRLVQQRNESAEFSEFKVMKKLDEKISEELVKFSTASENECFRKLKACENPMLEACKVLRFDVLKVREQKQEGGAAILVVETVTKAIDPLRLHKQTRDGIGANKSWPIMVEKLNCLLTARKAAELGKNPKEVFDCYAMSDAAKTYESFRTSGESDGSAYDKNAADERLLQDIQLMMNAMIGEGFTADDTMVNFLLSGYSRKDSKQSLSLTMATHKHLRQMLLELCGRAVTGIGYNLNYKQARN